MEMIEIPREGLEDALFDALYDSAGLMGVATRKCAKACASAIEAHGTVSAYNPDERLPELTDAMLEAGATVFCETQTLDPRKMTKAVYAAMMKAAPRNPDERLREALEPCGTNPSAIPADMVGCGEPFASFADAYRCAHCDVLFHKSCAEKHFSNENVLTEEMVVEIERRSALSPLPQGDDT